MKKLFIHKALFRLLSPVFSGVIVYLLILLLNNNVAQLEEQFIGEELYVCIGLSYLIQEFSRILLLFFHKLRTFSSAFLSLFFQIIVSMILCIVVVTVSITIYFDTILGFEVTIDEIITFNVIFCVITFIYILLFISHQYLYKINSEKLTQEKLIKQNIEDDFKQFKKGINPNLLFESFETLLVLIQNNSENSDDFIDHLATIYRYILSAKEKQLVSFKEELEVSGNLIKLFNYLPYRKVKLESNIKSSFFIIPGTLMFLIEQIVRTTIKTIDSSLIINLNDLETGFELNYIKNDTISKAFSHENVSDIFHVFSIYSEDEIIISETERNRKMFIPKLQIKS